MKFQEFLTKVDNIYHNDQSKNECRYGQTIMNILHEVWPDKYNQITNSDYDCFYDDYKVGLTLDKLEKEWQDD